ncbi:MAG: isochorismate synthase [Candidatus Heimdallarchaeota archaeon]|nr:isochorismate synthase [Candidatus Heimdallarchaeota archaeon]
MQTLEDFISKIKDKYSQGNEIQLISYYTELVGFDIETEGIELFNSFTTYPRMYWSNPHDGSILSFGQIREFKTDNHNYEGLDDFMSSLGKIHISNFSQQKALKVFGGLSFDESGSKKQRSAWKSFSSFYFYIPRIVIEKIDDIWLVSFNLNVTQDSLPTLKSKIQAFKNNFFKVITDIIGSKQKQKAVTVRKNTSHTSYENWEKNIDSIKDLIEKRKLDKLVLANSRKLELTASLNIIKSLYYLHQNFSNAYIFLFEPEPHNIFLGATPELLISKVNSNLETVALAGSRPRGIVEAEDIRYELDLLQSKKDNEEHQFVVNQISEKLSKIGITAVISERPTIHKLKNIQHLKTTITAKGEFRFTDLMNNLHPTAAVAGVPSEYALELIPELEKMYRGWYAGSIGWLDSQDNGRIAVAIRSSLIQNKTAHIYAGAGIVKNSDAESEWNEIGIKFHPMLRAIGAGRNTS